ncbi:hypothetical protein X772_26840 [Mesorhizobium sp. LSJC280B00]|nr:hypothetical protein X772_26840 [Mesorhizobium sp. LSJC280B00]
MLDDPDAQKKAPAAGPLLTTMMRDHSDRACRRRSIRPAMSSPAATVSFRISIDQRARPLPLCSRSGDGGLAIAVYSAFLELTACKTVTKPFTLRVGT